jgi:hypothetical protein
MIWKKDESVIWLDPFDAFFSINLLPSPQGEICEIGVYKGGFLMALLENLPQLTAVAIDPYPNSDEIRDLLISNLKDRKLQDKVTLLENYDSIERQEFDLIHIDGEHSESAVAKDLEFATKNLSLKGIVIIDDIWHPLFPGIISATLSFVHQEILAPFLITRNKMYLCKPIEFNYHHNRAKKLVELHNVPYSGGVSEGSYFLGESAPYDQSNSIKGYNQIVVKNLNRFQQSVLLGIEKPVKKSRIRNVLKSFIPPIFMRYLLRR